jgi:hypothetical protein
VVFELAALFEVVVPRLTTDGDFEPPQPDASKERLARTPANHGPRLEPDIRIELKQPSLKRP